MLTRTSRDEPAIEVRNETVSVAVLFDNRSCDGEAEKVLEPGEKAQRVEVVSVSFEPADREDPGRDDQSRDDEADQSDQSGRPEQNENRDDEEEEEEDLLTALFRALRRPGA
ncbi:hypothetical protein ACWGIU_32145 [Streptomyces sp. NPDC054840]